MGNHQSACAVCVFPVLPHNWALPSRPYTFRPDHSICLSKPPFPSPGWHCSPLTRQAPQPRTFSRPGDPVGPTPVVRRQPSRPSPPSAGAAGRNLAMWPDLFLDPCSAFCLSYPSPSLARRSSPPRAARCDMPRPTIAGSLEPLGCVHCVQLRLRVLFLALVPASPPNVADVVSPSLLLVPAPFLSSLSPASTPAAVRAASPSVALVCLSASVPLSALVVSVFARFQALAPLTSAAIADATRAAAASLPFWFLAPPPSCLL